MARPVAAPRVFNAAGYRDCFGERNRAAPPTWPTEGAAIRPPIRGTDRDGGGVELNIFLFKHLAPCWIEELTSLVVWIRSLGLAYNSLFGHISPSP